MPPVRRGRLAVSSLRPDRSGIGEIRVTELKMQLSLNVLNHLGINLYSNVPAILAEVVANGWDADAELVSITIDRKDGTIVIADDGHGMSEQDINDKFLTVGYERRKQPGEAKTPKWKRDVMGRKGIGKLSLFSIADEVEVQTTRNGEKNGFVMRLSDIRQQINEKSGTYKPERMDTADVTVQNGTHIRLRGLRKKLTNTETALRRRLARRFSVIGPQTKFAVEVNGKAIGPEDRDYGHKLQYLWYYGDKGALMLEQSKKLDRAEKRDIPNIQGWIGSVREAGALKDDDGENLNRIVVMVRGKLAQEDILEQFNQGGIYTKYLMGEIHADFLDIDEEEDIATSSRQSLIEDDPRYQELKSAIGAELAKIKNEWNEFRTSKGTDIALQIPAVSDWYKVLGPDERKRAKSLFGRINQLAVDDEAQRRTLIKHGVLAFESLRYRQNLDALQEISLDNLELFGEVFGHHDDLEATLYHQIISGRITVVKALQQQVTDNVKERVIQQYLFDHLWLLDPAWERATQTEYMEQRVETEFDAIDAGLSEEERQARIDIKYRKTGGRHVVIELKRAGVLTDTMKLMTQVSKYRNALDKLIATDGSAGGSVEIICVVGRELTDWTTPDMRQRSFRILKEVDARVVLYSDLIENAYKAYKEYLDKDKDTGRVFQLISAIESSLVAEEEDEAKAA